MPVGGLVRRFARVGHAPDGPRTVIGHHQRPILGDGHADGAAPHVAVFGDEAHQEVLELAGRLAVPHRHSDDLVADTAGPVPRAVLGREGVVVVLGREFVAVVEREVERGHVRLQEHVGDDHLVFQFGMLAGVARVLMRAEVVPRPAIEAAFGDVRDVVGHQVVAQFIPFVDRGPQLAGLGIRGQADGVADAGGEDALVLAIRVEGQDVGPPRFALVVIVIRSRANRDIQRLAIRRELEVPRPVPAAPDALVAAGDVRDDRFRRARRLRVSVPIREADNRVGVPNVNKLRLGANGVKGNSERPEAGGEDLIDLGRAITVGIAQHSNAIGPALSEEQIAIRSTNFPRNPSRPLISLADGGSLTV